MESKCPSETTLTTTDCNKYCGFSNDTVGNPCVVYSEKDTCTDPDGASRCVSAGQCEVRCLNTPLLAKNGKGTLLFNFFLFPRGRHKGFDAQGISYFQK